MNQYEMIQPSQIQGNPFALLGSHWALVTAGTQQDLNTMTVSWGALGVMWGQDVVQIVVRPQRYTKEFVDRTGRFSLSFYGPEYRQALAHLGKVSGREEDKIKTVGFTPKMFGQAPAFEQAELVLDCQVLYTQTIDPAGFMPGTDCDEKWYPNKDYHIVYVARIGGVWQKKAGL